MYFNFEIALKNMTLKTNAEYSMIMTPLFGLSESYAVVLHIKFCIKATTEKKNFVEIFLTEGNIWYLHKNIAKNPYGSHGWGNV